MSELLNEIGVFRRRKERDAVEARQRAAFFLISGIDLDAALETVGKKRATLLARLARLIERERLKGARRHWSYDLNRHIALKQAYDRLSGKSQGLPATVTHGRSPGVRRRGRRSEKRIQPAT